MGCKMANQKAKFFSFSLLVAGGSLVCISIARADEIYREYKSARHLSLGNAGLVNPRGQDAIFYNPAGVAQSKGILNEISVIAPTIEFSDNSRQLYSDITSGTVQMGGSDMSSIIDSTKPFSDKPQHVGVQNFTGLVFKRAALGILSNAQLDALYRLNKPLLPNFEGSLVTRNGIYASAARGFFDDSLLLGLTYKYVLKTDFYQYFEGQDLLNEERLKELTSIKKCEGNFTCGTGQGVDLGMIWKNEKANSRPRFGAVVHNVGGLTYSKYKSSGKAPSMEKQTIDIGIGIEPKAKNSEINAYLDFQDVANNLEENLYKRLHAGAEISFLNVAGVMAGINQGYSTFGCFVNFKVVRLDLGVYKEELGSYPGELGDKRFFGRLIVGWTQ